MATYTFKNTVEFNKLMIPIIEQMLDKISRDVQEEVNKALDDYYSEYDPASEAMITGRNLWYHRTNQLRECCSIGNIIKTGNGMSVKVFLDIDSLSYSTPFADAYKTVVSADSGLHGGWIADDLTQGQIPWENISDGDSDYGGTRIWSDPMEKLFTKGKLKQLFIKYAKQYGLTIV